MKNIEKREGERERERERENKNFFATQTSLGFAMDILRFDYCTFLITDSSP